jgi:hypothetical protein
MISIEGLTQRQRQIMDLLWACDTEEDAEEIILGLPTERDRWDGLALMRIAMMEVMELKGMLDEYRIEARSAVDRARVSSLR